MLSFNNAETMTAEQLVEEINDTCSNPTVQRLMFIETKGDPMKPDKPAKIFPCYVVAYTEDPELMFKLCLNQYAGGEFQMVEVIVPAKHLGVNKRIWDRPPTALARENSPWLDSEVAQ